jgi:5-(carboxyamino)imidazole ribonucleotide synthase
MGPVQRKRVGIVGGGQLGRMLALAGAPLGIECRLVDPSERPPAAQVAPVARAALDDERALEALAAASDVVTLEIENVAVAPLEALAARVPVYPPPAAIAAAQDRLAEKTLFRSLGIPTAPFVAVGAATDLAAAADELPLPIVLKTRRMGYDGRGQRVVRRAEDLAAAWNELGRAPAIAEAWVAFEREVSLIGVQGAGDERAFYPLAANTHRDGILDVTIAPYEDAALQQRAEMWLTAIMTTLKYRGVLTVEFFATRDGLVANEMAPRVHNSGHWTIEGAVTSQFENHLRAVLGWPLGATDVVGHSAMLNFVGFLPPAAAVLALPGAHYHDYGKDPRPNRKLGHCTLVDRDLGSLDRRLEALRRLTEGGEE